MIPVNRSEFYGDDTRWFVGRVISVNDPLEMGRVKVRIVGIHDNPEITVGDLPWAQVVIPITEGGSSGLGASTGIREQAQVFGIFLDGLHSQLPLVFGSMPKYENEITYEESSPFQAPAAGTSAIDPAVNKNTIPPDRVDVELLFGNTNIERSYNFLITKEGGNLTEIAASAVIGNFCQESDVRTNKGDLNPLATVNPGSFGIGQWNSSSSGGNRLGGLQSFAASINLSYTTLYAQLLWTRKELYTLPYYGFAELKSAKTIEEATLIFMRKYIRPTYEYDEYGKIKGEDRRFRRKAQEERIDFAFEIYRKFNT